VRTHTGPGGLASEVARPRDLEGQAMRADRALRLSKSAPGEADLVLVLAGLPGPLGAVDLVGGLELADGSRDRPAGKQRLRLGEVKVRQRAAQGAGLVRPRRLERRAQDPFAVVEQQRVHRDAGPLDGLARVMRQRREARGGRSDPPLESMAVLERDNGSLAGDRLQLPVVERMAGSQQADRGHRRPVVAAADHAGEDDLTAGRAANGRRAGRRAAFAMGDVAVVVAAHLRRKQHGVGVVAPPHRDARAVPLEVEPRGSQDGIEQVVDRDLVGERHEAPERTRRGEDLVA
jgi:hypothetical protein